MPKKYWFREEMMSDARLAAEALRSSPIARPLKAHGFTPRSMAAEAEELAALRVAIQAAKAELARATAALDAKARSFAERWSRYSSMVRGLTGDHALRARHGVKSPGRPSRSAGRPGARAERGKARHQPSAR